MKKRGPERMADKERRKRFQAVIAPATLSWLESHDEPAGRVIDRLVDNHKAKQDYDSRG